MTVFFCPCGQELLLDDEHLGWVVECPACGGEVEIPDVPYMGEAKKACPVCGSRQWRKITSRRAFKKKLPAASTWRSEDGEEELNTAFAFSLPRECNACQTIWLPPAPAWGVLFLIAIGASLALGGAAELFDLLPLDGRNKLDRSVLIAGIAAGISIVAWSVNALRGEKGRAKVLKLGQGESR
jgi:hypothetical protein